MPVHKVLKSPTIRRFPTYLYKLFELRALGEQIVSAPVLAEYMNIGEIVVRKDLALTGITGRSGVGYQIDQLIDGIKSFLNWHNTTEAVLVGAGSLGSAILGYEGFEDCGLKIIAAFDASAEKIGSVIHNRKILAADNLSAIIDKLKVKIGIICVPADYAQRVADQMVKGGIKGIWNFANVALKVPHDVIVQREVIAGGLALLSVKLANSRGEISD